MADHQPGSMDKKQLRKDIFRKNRYELDDRFIIRDGKLHKCAIICPGGGYGLVCSFIEGKPIAELLNAKGISCVIVYYRVKKKALYSNPQDDLARAIRETMDHANEWKLDMSDYSIWGSSAGGHLAASMGTGNMGYKKYQLPKPGMIELSYPVITLDRTLTHKGTHDNLIGKAAAAEKEEYCSIERQVDADYPRTYIWCGDADKTVPPENTRMMVKSLEAAGIEYACDIFPGVDHGVGPGIGTAAEGWIDKAVDFWEIE